MRRALEISLAVLAAALAVAACTGKGDDGFGSTGGSPYDTPPLDTSDPVASGDTADTADTASPSGDSADTAGPSGDSADTAGGSGTTGTTGDLVGTGYAVGDTAYDLAVSDQLDRPWSLYDQRGDVVVLVLGDSLDSTFTYIAGYLGAVDSSYGADVSIVAGVVYGADTGIADVADAAAIADTYGLSTVLYLSNPKDQYSWATIRPVVYVMDQHMVIQRVEYGIVDQSDIEGWIDALL